MLALLTVLVSVVGNVRGIQCGNWLDNSLQMYNYECETVCCVSGANYTVKLNKEEVCRDSDGQCTFRFSNDPLVPHICEVVLNGEEVTHDCGRGERCCHSSNITPPAEFNSTGSEVCSQYGVCESELKEDHFGVEILKDEYNRDHDYKDVACYSQCDYILESPVQDEKLKEHGFDICSKDQVQICDADKAELCIFLKINTTVLLTANSTHRDTAKFSFSHSYCGTLNNITNTNTSLSPRYHCSDSIDRFTNIARKLDWLYDDSMGWNDCGQVGVCEGGCVREAHRPPPKKDLVWWTITVLLIVFALVICCVLVMLIYCTLTKEDIGRPSAGR